MTQLSFKKRMAMLDEMDFKRANLNLHKYYDTGDLELFSILERARKKWYHKKHQALMNIVRQ